MTRRQGTSSVESPARRENGETHMTRKTLKVAAMVVALALTAGCGDVNGPLVTVDGGWPWFWPDEPAYVAERNYSETAPVAGQAAVRVEAVNGTVHVVGQPGAASVAVSARLRVGSNASRRDAEEGASRLGILVADRGDAILVQTQQPAAGDGRQYLVDYTITVPGQLSVDVAQVNGHVSVLDVESSVLVEETNGNVAFSGVLDAARVRLANGSVDGTVTLRPGGEIVASAIHGDVRLRVPRSASARVAARVGFGTIDWEGLELQDVVRTSRSLTGTLGDGAGRIDLETFSGNVRLVGF